MAEASAAQTTTSGARADGKPIVACQRLTKVFKDFWLRDRARAVDQVTFEIRPREIFGLLGPNGSGKSTCIKLILGLLRPTGGRIVVFGKAPTDVATKKRIGYLPEESYLYGFLNARETLDYYGKLFELDPRTRERRIDELLDMVGLTHAQHRPVRDYSKGMQRRIGLAQALINDPDLLILDEPTTGLDPIGTRQVKDLILELGRRGKTVLLSSHLLADVEDVVDRMVVLYGGKIRSEGTTQSLLESRGRTTIEADDLDEDTLAEIDRVIRERTGGEKSIRRVAKPRQKLEELFLDIVAKAQAERADTSGVTHGGTTASFLRSDDADQAESGEALVERLLQGEPAEADLAPAAVEGEPTADRASQPDRPEDVIGSLLGDDEAPQQDAPHEEPGTSPDRPPQAPGSPAPPPANVDLDVIGSLVNGGDRPGDAQEHDDDRGGGPRP